LPHIHLIIIESIDDEICSSVLAQVPTEPNIILESTGPDPKTQGRKRKKDYINETQIYSKKLKFL